MVKRVLIDVAIGAGLAFAAQILQYGAYLIGILVGLPFPYDTAPVDPASSPGWSTQVSLCSSCRHRWCSPSPSRLPGC